MKLGKKIEELRGNKSKFDFALELEIDAPRYWELINGKREFSLNLIFKVCEKMNLSLSNLIEDYEITNEIEEMLKETQFYTTYEIDWLIRNIEKEMKQRTQNNISLENFRPYSIHRSRMRCELLFKQVELQRTKVKSYKESLNNKVIGQRVISQMILQGIQFQKDLAAICDIDYQALSRILNGTRTPTVNDLIKLGSALDVPVSYLVGDIICNEKQIYLLRALKELPQNEIDKKDFVRNLIHSLGERRVK